MAPRSDQAGDTSSLRSSPPSSSPCGLLTEDDESSSDGHKDDEKEEEGGVETAVDKVVELFEQGQQAQQKIVVGVVQQVSGCSYRLDYVVLSGLRRVGGVSWWMSRLVKFFFFVCSWFCTAEQLSDGLPLASAN